MKTVIIVQARMGSTRLPGKMMMSINGRPMVEYVFDRVGLSKLADEVWLATTVSAQDDVLAQWAEKNNIHYFRGSEDDVLDRYYQTAKQAEADIVARVTGDCPLADYEVIDQVIAEYKEGGYDYVSNVHPPTYPDGLDMEVFSFEALEKAWKEAKLPSEREHVTPYIWENPDKFKMKNITAGQDFSAQRWTLDTKEDFELIEKIILECDRINSKCGMAEILEILATHSEWLKINDKYGRNEGYKKSEK
ncbi:MAG: hypothetical protein A2206_01170 [Candidatus Magasanikbacteria bacterium RIFOXYA1_FULL_40_8]|uniref:Acylneuraminate cytidylyltransferase n=1 Tax=Candidatus Magasanikbacteria bacterium RIFOXYA1_FULL_40_8 TaxID=1798694 RepID=A0A1F6NU80_9BACT|nr:MAG: hypothetical protein A2206_01170 [Candidatus Magasanikbacteria bacterium RIFOXYA1_FULL_40_8]